MSRILVLLLLVPLCVLAADVEPESDAKADAKKLQGTWSIVEATGPDTPPDDIKKVKFTFDKDTIKVSGTADGREEPAVKFTLAVKKGVREIDIQPPGGEKPVQGLYKFEKDQLTLTFFRPGGGRPTKFGDKSAQTIVLKKDKK